MAEQYKVHPDRIGQWRQELLERAAEVFATAAEKCDAGPDVKTLHDKIGQLALENDFSYGPPLQAERRFPSRTATGIS